MAAQLGVPAAMFAEYARRPQTMTDHARELATALGLRAAIRSDLSVMIEAGAAAAWSTDKGFPIAAGIVDALRRAGIMLPAPAVVERTGIAGRARARKRAADALLDGLTGEQLAALDSLLVVNQTSGLTTVAWLKTIPGVPKADHVRDLVDKLRAVRAIGIDRSVGGRIHESRLRQLVREGHGSPAYLLDRYTVHRRRATLAALLIDLEPRLTDAVLDMADKLIGNAFTRAKNTKERSYAATTKDVARLMRLFEQTIDALRVAKDGDRDAMTVIDESVGWAKLLRARGEVVKLADLADEDPLMRAADRYAALRKFAPLLLEALEFKATKSTDQTLAAIQLLRELNQSGKRDVPANAPMPFRKEWRRLVGESGRLDRRLYETAVLATVRNRLRSGDIWVEQSSSYRRFDSYLLPPAQVAPIAAELGLPSTADEWLDTRGRELDLRLKWFGLRLRRGQLEGVEMRDGRLIIAPIRYRTVPRVCKVFGAQLFYTPAPLTVSVSI
jgi:Domain of unknown function (DUF4158)